MTAADSSRFSRIGDTTLFRVFRGRNAKQKSVVPQTIARDNESSLPRIGEGDVCVAF